MLHFNIMRYYNIIGRNKPCVLLHVTGSKSQLSNPYSSPGIT